MKIFFLLIIPAMLLFGCKKDSSISDPVVPEFQKTYGGYNDEEASAIIHTSDNNFLIAGYTTTYGNGTNDAYLVKIDQNGNMLWQKAYGGANWDYASDVIETPDGGYLVIGRSKSFKIYQGLDVYVFKIDKDGNLLWQKVYGNDYNDCGEEIILCPDNSGYMIIGGTGGVGAFCGGYIYILKINGNGDTLWTRQYSDQQQQIIYDGISITADKNGNYMLFCNTYSDTSSYEGMMILKVDANGDSIWSKIIDGRENEMAGRIRITKDGGVILCGQTNSLGDINGDMYAAKLNEIGVTSWEQHFGGMDFDAAESVIQTSGDDGFLFAGISKSFTNGTQDMYLVKTDAFGINKWSKIIGTAYHDAAYDLVETKDAFIIVGSTRLYHKTFDLYVIKIKKQ